MVPIMVALFAVVSFFLFGKIKRKHTGLFRKNDSIFILRLLVSVYRVRCTVDKVWRLDNESRAKLEQGGEDRRIIDLVPI